MKKASWMLLALLCGLGCAGQGPPAGVECLGCGEGTGGMADEDAYHALALGGAGLEGDLGEVHDFSSDEALHSGYMEPGDRASVTIQVAGQHASGESWVAMAILRIEGGLLHPSLQPGSHLEFGQDLDLGGDPDGVGVTVLGCSGPSSARLLFDRDADEVEVDVSEGTAGARRFDFTAAFADDDGGGSQILNGWFELAP